MSENGNASTPAPTAPPAVQRRALRRLLWSLAGMVALFAVLAGLVTSVFWAAGTTTGSRWLIARLALVGVYVQVTDLEGTLIGDFKARQVVVKVGHTQVTVDKPVWRNLSVNYTRNARTWARIHVSSLVAERVVISVEGSGKSTPFKLPRNLLLPVELEIDDVQAAELHVPGLRDHPFREVRSQVHLGQGGGRAHRFEHLSGRLDPLAITGHARIDATGPMSMSVDLSAVQSPQAQSALPAVPAWATALRTDWQAHAQAQGPLAQFDMKATLRAQGQSLDASAQVTPEAPWALTRLEAATQGLDLSALLQQAPLTHLNGTLRITPETPETTGASAGQPHTLALAADITNAKPGRWDQRQLPVRSLAMAARWRTDQADELTLQRFEATLADERRPAGTLQGTARWKAGEFAVDAALAKVLPAALHASLPAMTLSGPINVTGKMQPRSPSGAAAPPRFTALADLSGQLVDPPRAVQLRLDATGSEDRIVLRELRARADGTRAEVSGTAERASDHWQVKARAALVEFDPRPWFPAGPRGGWRAGAHRINLEGSGAITIADSVRSRGPEDTRALMERLAGLQGEANVKVGDSVMANLPITANAHWRHGSGEPMQTQAVLDVGGNHVSLDGQFAAEASGHKDRWTLEARAPELARMAPLLQSFLPQTAAQLADNLSGSLTADAQASGRWPDMTTQGNAVLKSVRTGAWSVGQGDARWQASSNLGAPLSVQINLAQAAWADRKIGPTTLQLQGTGRDHQFTFNSELLGGAVPPVWMENLQGTRRGAAPVAAVPASAPVFARRAAASAAAASASAPAASASAPAASASAPAASASAPAASAPASASPRTSAPAAKPTTAQAIAPPPEPRGPLRTLVSASAKGGLTGNLLQSRGPGDTRPAWSWKGVLQQFELRSAQPGATPLITTSNIALELHGGPPMRASVSAGRADILGAGLKWSRIDWVSGQGIQTQQLDMQAELEPLAVAPLLRRINPDFGWGGDLEIAGKVILKQTDRFTADIVLERTRGDLTVTEESGTQALGLQVLRVGLDANDGVWNFTAGLAGDQLGVLGGALVVRTSPQAAWPADDAPVQGVLEAQVANLGTWGAWVPAGWRLDGRLNISATLGGRFNAREYTGKMIGSGIGVRNMVEGINVTDGQVDISLQGDTARINTFSARGGDGTLRLEGDAQLGEKLRARLKLVANKFQALGRVDLRVVGTGEANVLIDGENVKTDGRITVDEGLIDFTRLSSPALSDDVIVTGRSKDPREAAPTAPDPTGANRFQLDLLVNLGQNLRMRGLGIDTKLRGELHVSRPGGKWALNGTVNTVEGSYAGYNQKLDVDRGVIVFNGPPSDMRLDIEATRPNLDLRVGVKVSGPLANLRTRIFSEPEMSMNEKLSWLVLGRASDGLGKSDTALVQRAAFALLAGEGEDGGGPGAITKAIGIDELGLRQSEGDSRETVVSVGKQLSKRVFVAYEQNLTTNSGSFQVTYRIAQRFVMRLQSGLDRSIDLIGTWRWE